jgi:hypothetical protein
LGDDCSVSPVRWTHSFWDIAMRLGNFHDFNFRGLPQSPTHVDEQVLARWQE